NTEKKRWVWSKYNARPLDALAIRTAGNFTTASTTLVDATDMELSIVLGEAATVRFDWPLTFSNNSAGAEMRFNIEIDNTTLIFGTAGLAADATTAAQSYAIALGGDTAELAAGEHTIKGQWSASAGTGTIKATTTRPSRMTATEIR
ncbi:MAG: hypothetical protein KAI73_03660, partial [Rhodospirillaceae bacterium]|nr:hypothetical protein [Rhodospirillaceae bacterium]